MSKSLRDLVQENVKLRSENTRLRDLVAQLETEIMVWGHAAGMPSCALCGRQYPRELDPAIPVCSRIGCPS